MDQSQYLVQALQQMQDQPQAAAPQGMSVAQMAQMAQNRKAWEAANPGGSYMAHGVMQAGRDIAAAPGNVASGFARLAQSLPGMAPQAMPVDPRAAPWAYPQ